jgi:hypothetical protein
MSTVSAAADPEMQRKRRRKEEDEHIKQIQVHAEIKAWAVGGGICDCMAAKRVWIQKNAYT